MGQSGAKIPAARFEGEADFASDCTCERGVFAGNFGRAKIVMGYWMVINQ
jgi:hypothetical protein